MNRTPAAHRLVTKKARQERAWRRQVRRNYPVRYVLGWDGSRDDIALTAAYEREFYSSRYPISVVGVTPESWFSPPRLRSVGAMPAEYRRLVERTEAPHAALPHNFGVTAEEWAEHMRKVGQAYGYSAGEYSAGKRNEEA